MTKSTKSKAIATSTLTELLKKHDAALVSDLLAQVDAASALEKKGTNVALRKQAYRKALAENNKYALLEVAEARSTQEELAPELASFADEALENGLTDEQAVVAMRLLLAGKTVEESTRALYELTRSVVFRSLDLAFEEAGEEFPENTNGFIDVPETGKRFSREGAGRKAAKIDFEVLREAVGAEVFDKITTPKVSYVLNEAALAEAVLADNSLLEQVREAVVPGDWNSPRLMIRDIPANEKE